VDFQLSEEQRELQQAARRYVREELAELARETEATSESPSLEWMKKFAEMGFLGINIAEQYGGMGLGNIEALIVLEEFARLSPAVGFPVFESSVGPARAIEHFARPELAARLLPRVCAGELLISIAMSEPEAGTAVTDLKTRGRQEGDSIVLNGQKRWCSGGGHSEGYLVYCRLSDAPGAKGIGALYVDREMPGVSFGAREQLMGFRGVYSADIYFDDVPVPLENIVVPAGGFPKLMQAFDLERCGNATMCLGIAAGALEYVLEYVQERRQFGKPICDFQAVQLKLAEMQMRVEASRLLIWRAAQSAADGLPSILDSSVAKCFANEMAREVCGTALQLMGAYGYSKEYPLEQRLRDSWGWGIAGGTIDIQKINIAAAMIGRRFDQRA